MLYFREILLRTFLILRRFRWVGTDLFGNIYYEGPSKIVARKTRRFIIYKGSIEASSIPPLWNAWLHFTLQDPPMEKKDFFWQKKHLPNLTGTIFAHKPTFSSKNSRSYVPWKPTKKGSI